MCVGAPSSSVGVAGIVVQWIKPQPVTLASHINAGSCAGCALIAPVP